MRIANQWVGWGLGDSDEEVRTIKSFMRKKLSYASALADTTVYDQQMVIAVAEMQKRYNAAGTLPTGKYASGIINFATKVAMGFVPAPPKKDTRPVLFTVCGTGVPWWVGPDADTARAVAAQYIWQPIGYPAQAVPMGPSITAGCAELAVQLNKWRSQVENYGAALAGYSQGAVITSSVWEYQIKPANGPLHWAMPFIRKAVAWGNPMREKGKSWPDAGAPMAGPSTQGVTGDLMKDTPDWWRNYAHVGDLYTTSTDDAAGQDKTAIWQIIRGTKVFAGPDNLLSQFLEISQQPVPGAIGAFKAIMDAGMFFGQQTGPHINYSTAEAIAYLRSA
jgi:hypothetical protein